MIWSSSCIANLQEPRTRTWLLSRLVCENTGDARQRRRQGIRTYITESRIREILQRQEDLKRFSWLNIKKGEKNVGVPFRLIVLQGFPREGVYLFCLFLPREFWEGKYSRVVAFHSSCLPSPPWYLPSFSLYTLGKVKEVNNDIDRQIKDR